MSCNLIELTESSSDLPMLINVDHIVSVKSIRCIEWRGKNIRPPSSRLVLSQGVSFDVSESVKEIYDKYSEINKSDKAYKPVASNDNVLNKPVFPTLKLNTRTVRSILHEFKGTTLSEFIQLSAINILDWRNMGVISLAQLRAELKRVGLNLKGDECVSET